MTFPTEFDWMLVKKSDGASPPNFVMICGIQDVNVNLTANTADRFVRDCAKPGATPRRKVKVNGIQMDITGTGLSNADTVPMLMDSVGKHVDYQIEGYADDGTDAGELLGTFSGTYVMTASNLTIPRTGDASGEITLASHGDFDFDPA
jgi:hypothetical protein